MPSINDLMAVAEVDLLLAAGVDNWEGYEDSLDSYEEADDIYEDASNWLNALAAGGVDNWDGYDEVTEPLNDYRNYLRSLTDLDKAESVDDFA